MRKVQVFALLLALVLFAGACAGAGESESSGGEGGGATDAAAGGSEGGGGSAELSLNQVRLAIDNDDFMNQIAWMVADENYWPDLGFTEPAEVVATDEYLAGLFGGSVWVAQGESDVIWSALAEGSVPMKIIGVEKDTEAWFLGVREGVDQNNLEGLRISGGPVGDRNITVGEHILEDMGVDPQSLEWVPVEGGSDERLQAMLAGQLDAAVLQPRHLIPLNEGGGKMIYQEYRDAPQELWVVTEETMANNRDAVCAYLEGRIAAKQWLSEGEDYTDNQEAGVAIARERGLDPSEGDLDEWATEMEGNWALDGGAPAEAFDAWNQDMIDNGNVPEGFDWKEHADLSCLWEAQENLGLEQNPVESEVTSSTPAGGASEAASESASESAS
jgi:ABC-type nitrate/sulfonate/bicarbonate transport system substrate-binding protein